MTVFVLAGSLTASMLVGCIILATGKAQRKRDLDLLDNWWDYRVIDPSLTPNDTITEGEHHD